MYTQQQMLEDIARDAELTAEMTGRQAFSEVVMDAMATVPRNLFVDDEQASQAFYNIPLCIGHGQTISQPYIVALMTDLINPQPEHICLELGTGSGYQAAVLSLLVRRVYSVEIVPALHRQAAARLRKLGYDNIDCLLGGEQLGDSEHAPYDAILVTAAADPFPEPLLTQLKPGGRMVIPVGSEGFGQVLYLVKKSIQGTVSRHPLLAVRFVPLIAARQSP